MVSTKNRARRQARNKIADGAARVEKAQKELRNAKDRHKRSKKQIEFVDDAAHGKTPAALTPADLAEVPKAVREEVEENHIQFKPHDGPQMAFLSAPEREVLYGGSAGGGKSWSMCLDPLRYCHHSDFRALMLRRTLKELQELVIISRSIYPKAFPGTVWKESKHKWEFPSGATIELSYVDRDIDVEQYQGQAFAWIGVDELGQMPTPYVWNYLRSRCRTTNPEIISYMRASANPGGQGQWWLKKMFLDPAPWGESFWATDIETGKTLRWPKDPEHCKSVGGNPDNAGKPLYRRRFIPAKLSDNPTLMSDPQYLEMLLSLPEVQRRQLLEGDWDVSEGAAFTEFSREKHVVEPFQIPFNWPRIRAGDYGYAAPSCILWGAVDNDGVIWIYRELYRKGLTAEVLGDEINSLEANDPTMSDAVLDSSCWNDVGLGTSVALTMMDRGTFWRPSDRDRDAGKQEVHRRLSDGSRGKPRVRFFNNCTDMIRTLPMLPVNKTNPEDVDTKAEDHAYDALRYMFMARPSGATSPYNYTHQHVEEPLEVLDDVFGY